jgi:hypothetical protein
LRVVDKPVEVSRFVTPQAAPHDQVMAALDHLESINLYAAKGFYYLVYIIRSRSGSLPGRDCQLLSVQSQGS